MFGTCLRAGSAIWRDLDNNSILEHNTMLSARDTPIEARHKHAQLIAKRLSERSVKLQTRFRFPRSVKLHKCHRIEL